MFNLSDFEYYGLSTETKPTQAASSRALTVGSVFYETDTGNAFTWNGTAWVAAVFPGLGLMNE